ncbi:MAG: hypothetical protein JKY60_09885 [Kordiimonadaceae bacterium]|nr:hypothetical protein [Kordiimonadaceae bacterium]
MTRLLVGLEVALYVWAFFSRDFWALGAAIVLSLALHRGGFESDELDGTTEKAQKSNKSIGGGLF